MTRESSNTSKGKVTAKATSGTLAKAYSGRQAIFVCNPSAKEVWLALGETAAKEEGIWLKKEGGTAVIEGGYTGIVTCITSEGEGTITYAEV
jgi:hypothetical protein